MTEFLSTSSGRSLGPQARTLLLVWAALMAATLLSWHLGAGNSTKNAAIVVIVVGVVKVQLIGDHFMELRHAPLALRLLFGGWCLVVGTCLTAMFVLA
ncbi:cytochrome C oxidase subunit IV family protein [Nocardia sp. NPDC004860]|uniref:cytochrome C oxidase subunit IV family protein n=1 Tax=Nocardia sp. NPDC004860 TaxID=3154557 RepID=UPI0033B9DA9F